MPPGAEWTLHYQLRDGAASRADFAWLQGHPEVREADLTESVTTPITILHIRFVDDVQVPRDPALIALYRRTVDPQLQGPLVPDPDLPPWPLGPDSIELSPEMMEEYRLLRQDITVLGPDIGNPEQWWRRQADGLLGRTVSRPVNGIVRLQGFANAGAALEVPYDTFIRDWLPTENPATVPAPEPEPPTFWDRLLAEES